MGADLGTQDDMWPFLERVLSFCANHVLRNLKYRARIPIPGSWMLVGVADEYDLLQEGEIYGECLFRRSFVCCLASGKHACRSLEGARSTSKGLC